MPLKALDSDLYERILEVLRRQKLNGSLVRLYRDWCLSHTCDMDVGILGTGKALALKLPMKAEWLTVIRI